MQFLRRSATATAQNSRHELHCVNQRSQLAHGFGLGLEVCNPRLVRNVWSPAQRGKQVKSALKSIRKH
eukprot:13601327-Alexandrium_andersonii.AAC.1